MTDSPNRRRFLAQTSLTLAAAAALKPHSAHGASGGRIRVGQIGTAHSHAAGKYATLKKFSEVYDIVGIVEPDSDRKAAAQKRPEYKDANWMTEQELLETADLQCVAVETDMPDLVPTGQRCVDAGMHIHLDKPAGESLAEFRKLHETAGKKQLCIQLGYMFRYNPAFELAAGAVADGWLGTVFEVHGVMSKKVSQSARDHLMQYPGGTMYELGCHLVDALVWILGQPTETTSLIRKTMDDSLADNMLATFQYPKATATLRSSVNEPFGFRRRQFTIVGTKGVVDIRPLEPAIVNLSLEEPRGEFKRGSQLVDLRTSTGRYDSDLLDLAAVIRGEKKLTWDAKHDLAAHETILRASGMDVEK